LSPALRVSLPRRALRLRVDRGIAPSADRRRHRRAVSEALLLDPEARDLRPASRTPQSDREGESAGRRTPEGLGRRTPPSPRRTLGLLDAEGRGGVAQRRLLLLAHQRTADAQEAALLRRVRHALPDLLQPLREPARIARRLLTEQRRDLL